MTSAAIGVKSRPFIGGIWRLSGRSTGVVMASIIVVSGFAIYQPTQLYPLPLLFGNRDNGGPEHPRAIADQHRDDHGVEILQDEHEQHRSAVDARDGRDVAAQRPQQ